jgi:hypothetical protein
MSVSAYARHRGVSHVAVLKAAKTGRIHRRPDGKIDSETADREWVENTNQAKPSNSVTGDPKHRRGPGEPPRPTLRDPSEAPAPGVRGNGSDRVAGGYAAARAIRESYDARLRQLDFEIRKGKYVEADEIKVAAFNRARRARDLLFALPDRLAAVLAAESEATSCHKILTEEITRVCEELARVPGH